MPYKHFRIDELRVKRASGMTKPTMLAAAPQAPPVNNPVAVPKPEEKVAR